MKLRIVGRFLQARYDMRRRGLIGISLTEIDYIMPLRHLAVYLGDQGREKLRRQLGHDLGRLYVENVWLLFIAGSSLRYLITLLICL